MRAISIKQPWVELILQGKKKREFRSKATTIRGRVYLYASLKALTKASEWKKAGKTVGTLPTGRIVGTVNIIDCRITSDGYAYILAAPRRLRRSKKPKNQPQPVFWNPEF